MTTQRFEDLAYANGFNIEKQGDMYIHPYTDAAYKIYLQAQKDELLLRKEEEELLIEHQKEVNATLLLAETRVRDLHDINTRLVNSIKSMLKIIEELV